MCSHFFKTDGKDRTNERSLTNPDLSFAFYYSLYVDTSIIEKLKQFNAVFLQGQAFSKNQLDDLGNLKIGYLSLGEFNGDADERSKFGIDEISLEKNWIWHSVRVDISKNRWKNYLEYKIGPLGVLSPLPAGG